MKKLIAIIAVALPLAFSARAQWIVYDPTSNIQQIVDQAANIAKYIQMIENQVIVDGKTICGIFLVERLIRSGRMHSSGRGR